MVVGRESISCFGTWARRVPLFAKSGNVGHLNFRFADAILTEGESTLRLPQLVRLVPKRDDLYCKLALLKAIGDIVVIF